MLSYKEELGLGYPDNPDNTNELCWGWFLVDQMAKSNSKATIDSYPASIRNICFNIETGYHRETSHVLPIGL